MREGWTYKTLGDCLSYIKNGANIKQSREAASYPITRIETLSGGVFNRDRLGYANIFDLKNYSLYVLDDGDILMSHINSKAYIGRAVQYIKNGDESIIHGMNLLRLKTIRSILYPSYSTYVFKSSQFKNSIAKIRKDAVNQSSFAIGDLKKISIPIPPLQIQQSIVDELDKINDLIKLKKAQLSDLDNLAQSIFYEMFGDPVENEKGWEVKKLGEVCDVTSSKRIFAEEYTTYGIPFYRGKEVSEKSKNLPISIELYISKSRYEELKKGFEIPKIGDILVTAVGTIGNIWVVDDDSPFYFKDGNIIWIRNIQNIYSVYYKNVLTLLIDAFKKELARGAAYNALTIVNIKKMTIPLPPLSLQQSFSKKIEAIEEQKKLINSTIKDLETLLASRMQYWFD